MSQTSTLKLDRFDKICRTCLSEIRTDCSVSIFKTYFGDRIVKDMLQLCASVKIEENDNLPPHICNNCLAQLVNWSSFTEQCQESDILLKSVIIKEEIANEGVVEIIVKNDEQDNKGDVMTLKTKRSKVRRKRKLRCSECTLEFNSLQELNAHERLMNHKFRLKRHMCSYCGKAFATRDHLNRHTRSHTNEKPYSCKFCGMRFSVVQNLRRHEKIHTGERPYKCDVCGKGFIQKTSLINHQKSRIACIDPAIISERNGLRCEHCGKTFKRSTCYNLHLQRHLPKTSDENLEQKKRNNDYDIRNYVCDVCQKGYKNKSTLKMHQLTHGEKNFLCSECGKSFVTKPSLQSHQKVHTKEKPHTCGICNKSFAYTGNFDTHMLLHTGVKKYTCTVCSKSFTQGTHLKYHMRIHSGEKPYSCNFCGKSFAVKTNLTVHVRIHTGETPFSCPVCQKSFYDSGSLKKHRRLHGEVNVEVKSDLDEQKT